MKNTKFLLFLALLLPLNIWAGTIFKVKCEEGYDITYMIMSDVEVAVGSRAGNQDIPNDRAITTSATGNITIPSEVEWRGTTYTVTSLGSKSFRDCSLITSIVLPATIISIGDYAFEGCSGLININIPAGVTSIGNDAFSNCSSLKSIVIPEGMTSIGNNTFSRCSSLSSITIPEGMTSIGNTAFYGCSVLSSIIIPESVTSIGDYAFGSSGITNLSLPKRITSIGPMTFAYCGDLTSISIPDGVTSIGYSAFYNCSSLPTISIPASVTAISHSAFEGCVNLATVILEGITSIDDKAFFNCSGLNSFNVNGGVTSIGNSAFKNCSALTTITIPQGIPSIGDSAFEGCNSLTDITILQGVSSIGISAFINCSSLTTVTISGGITSIGSTAFSGCSNLTTVTIPGVTLIGDKAFYQCKKLAVANIGNSLTNVGDYAFYQCEKLANIDLSQELTTLGELAFAGCGLQEISVSGKLQNISRYAFGGCKNLQNVIINEGVKNIGENSFSGCTSLHSITISNSVVSIGNNAFYFCGSLEEVDLGSGLTSIGEQAFIGCGLKTISIPSSVTSIEKSAFSRCSSLSSVIVNINNVINLPTNVFSGISSDAILFVPYSKLESYKSDYGWRGSFKEVLESAPTYGNEFTASMTNGEETIDVQVTVVGVDPCVVEYGTTSSRAIPAEHTGDIILSSYVKGYDMRTFQIVGIHSSAFSGVNISSIVVPEGVTYIGSDAFKNCSQLGSLYLPRSINVIEDRFEGCGNLSNVYVNWRIPSKIEIFEDAFGELPDGAILHVPAGTKSRYEEHPLWSKFSEIVEISPISTGDVSTACGSVVSLPLILNNNIEVIKGIQFKLSLPDGVSVVEGNHIMNPSTTDRSDRMTILGRKDPESPNSYQFVMFSLDGEAITGSEGPIMNIALNIDEDTKVGQYDLKISEIYMTTTSFDTQYPLNSISEMTVNDYKAGDVSGDGIVDVSDCVGIANHILGHVSEDFNLKAADVNHDNKVDVSDCVGLANIILFGAPEGRASNNARSVVSEQQGEKEPD